VTYQQHLKKWACKMKLLLLTSQTLDVLLETTETEQTMHGGDHFVLGRAVTGGLYGTLPDLTLGGDDDISQKGRLIPTTSMTQYLGTIVKWFGVDEAMLNEIFPERVNFTEKDLGFMGS
jgi:uncharacterized protein (DUF1501 family)